MLSYQLYLESQNNSQDPGKGIPIKKLFVDKDNITIDNTTLAQFGDIESPLQMTQFLKTKFDMPLDTTLNLNLPNKIVASNSSKPYVTISGSIKTTKKKDDVIGEITLTLKTKDEKSFAKINIPDYDDPEITSSDTPLKIDSKNYKIGSQMLYDAYCQNQILQNDRLGAGLFERIAKKFFEFIKLRDVNFILGNCSFLLYVLPSNDTIEHIKKQPTQGIIKKPDSFGNDIVAYPSDPTKGVYFLSYDDKAFTINCHKKQQFYQNLGIGSVSFKKILLPNSKLMKISYFNWYFTDLDNRIKSFENKKTGIYAQLHNNYVKMKSELNTKRSVDLSITCVKQIQSKLEVILYENLSMQKMQKIFSSVQTSDIPPFALELLQIVKGKKTIINRYYIMAIKSLLNQTPFDGALLLKIFVNKLQDNLPSWLAEKTDKNAREFFRKSEFCYKVLNISSFSKTNVMESDFAIKVGKMTRAYIDFRKTHDFTNNSLRDILSKPKYDVATLQLVVKQIGRGIHLLNMDEKKYDAILSILSDCVPSANVDIDSRRDLSYHFYMGYFGGKQA